MIDRRFLNQNCSENRYAPEDVLGIYEPIKYLYRFIFYEDLVRKAESR